MKKIGNIIKNYIVKKLVDELVIWCFGEEVFVVLIF